MDNLSFHGNLFCIFPFQIISTIQLWPCQSSNKCFKLKITKGRPQISKYNYLPGCLFFDYWKMVQEHRHSFVKTENEVVLFCFFWFKKRWKWLLVNFWSMNPFQEPWFESPCKALVERLAGGHHASLASMNISNIVVELRRVDFWLTNVNARSRMAHLWETVNNIKTHILVMNIIALVRKLFWLILKTHENG